VIHEYAPHQPRRDSEEVRTIAPANILCVDETQIGFVHERGGLQRMPRSFARHVASCQPPQL
jgi:hypothetical protein